MAAEFVDRLAILVAVHWFPSMGATDSRSLRSDSYARMRSNISFVDLFMFPFDGFWGMCGDENSRNVFLCFSWYLGFLSSRRFA
jgi:hypothetical protein